MILVWDLLTLIGVIADNYLFTGILKYALQSYNWNSWLLAR